MPLDDSSMLYNKPVHPSPTGVELSELGENSELCYCFYVHRFSNHTVSEHRLY